MGGIGIESVRACQTGGCFPLIWYLRTFVVAWPVAELSAVPPGGERHQVGSDPCGRCHFGGPNRVGDLASGQPAALVKQFDRKLVKLRSASARGRRGHLASVKAMTEKGGG